MSSAGNIWVSLRLRDKATQEFRQKMNVMRNSVVKMMAGYAGFNFLKSGVSQLSTAAEAQDSLNRLIGEKGTKALMEFGKTASQTAGLSRAEVLDTANKFAGLFKVIPEGAIDTGNALVGLEQRVADLGSQFEKSNEEIFTGLQSALSGRISLTLQQMGIYLNETAMKTKILAGEFQNIGYSAETSWSKLTEGEKVLLRYQAFMGGTKESADNFAATLGISLPNQIKTMKSSFKNAAADLSKSLIPSLMKLIPMLSKLAEFIANNTKLIWGLAGAFAGFKIAKFVVSMGKAIMALYAFAVAKAGAEGGIAGVITGGAVAAGLGAILGGIAGGMFFGGSGGGGGSSSGQPKAAPMAPVNITVISSDPDLRVNGNGANFGRGGE